LGVPSLPSLFPSPLMIFPFPPYFFLVSRPKAGPHLFYPYATSAFPHHLEGHPLFLPRHPTFMMYATRITCNRLTPPFPHPCPTLRQLSLPLSPQPCFECFGRGLHLDSNLSWRPRLLHLSGHVSSLNHRWVMEGIFFPPFSVPFFFFSKYDACMNWFDPIAPLTFLLGAIPLFLPLI